MFLDQSVSTDHKVARRSKPWQIFTLLTSVTIASISFCNSLTLQRVWQSEAKVQSLRSTAQIFKQKVEQIDFSLVKQELQTFHHWTPEQTEVAIGDYRAFLYLVHLYPDRLHIPSPQIDTVIHCHVLITDKYVQDCQLLFGEYLHHLPLSRLEALFHYTPDDVSVLYAQTQDALREHCNTSSSSQGGEPACGVCLNSSLNSIIATV